MKPKTEKTEQLYLDDTYRFDVEARVLSAITNSCGRCQIAVDRTIFYPKGGGQPADRGLIEAPTAELEVEEVFLADDVVIHVGTLVGAQISAGDRVHLKVDAERRLLHARLHTAGELLCAAMWGMGYSYPCGWSVSGAIHYPERSSVEFGAVLAQADREPVKERLERELNRLVDEGGQVQVSVVDGRAAAAELCGFVPDYLPENGSIRVVKVAGEFGRPCGGTHVARLSDVGSVRIRKLKCRKGRTVISYMLVETQELSA